MCAKVSVLGQAEQCKASLECSERTPAWLLLRLNLHSVVGYDSRTGGVDDEDLYGRIDRSLDHRRLLACGRDIAGWWTW
jgi:hypothetical protein